MLPRLTDTAPNSQESPLTAGRASLPRWAITVRGGLVQRRRRLSLARSRL